MNLRSDATPGPSPRRRRWGFAVGALAGFVLGVPATVLTVWLLARAGLGNEERSLGEVLRLDLWFVTAPSVLSAGGTARVALRAASREGARTIDVVRAGAQTFAAAGAGLTLIGAIPMGDMPSTALPYVGFVAAGAVSGAGVGAIIGLWASTR